MFVSLLCLVSAFLRGTAQPRIDALPLGSDETQSRLKAKPVAVCVSAMCWSACNTCLCVCVQVIPCTQRDALYCLHENGCITLRVCRSTTAPDEAAGRRTHTPTHTRTHARAHAHTHARMRTHTLTQRHTHLHRDTTYTHLHTHLHTPTHSYTHLHTYTLTHTCTHINTHTRQCIHLRLHTHLHAPSHKHIHTHTANLLFHYTS